MRSPMEEGIFLDFYKNTVMGYSNGVMSNICTLLLNENKITFETQRSLGDPDDIMYFESKRDFKKIIAKTTTNLKLAGFYEKWEFTKLYKYSLPLFWTAEENNSLEDFLKEVGGKKFDSDNFIPEFVLGTTLKEATPLYWVTGEAIFVKFVLQKSYFQPETFEPIDYRYPVVIYIDLENGFLDIRYDAKRYNSNGIVSNEDYESIVTECIGWLKNSLHINLYACDHSDIITIINDRQNGDVRMYKQMMQMSTGASAELTASESKDYVLPFIGELRELIDENEDIFNQAEAAKSLLLRYLDDKEETASYPYIYIKWVKPVESQSYIVKVTFDYFSRKFTLLQHITGGCKDLGMERMNDAIKYLCESGSFIKGEEI